jgi:hypothetical protein
MTPNDLVSRIGKDIPGVWESIKFMRSGKGKDLPDWGEDIYLPIAAGYSISSKFGKQFDAYCCPASITAAASWRVSKGIYRFDADVYNSLMVQKLDGNIPCDVLKRLPEWCVYIETPNLSFCELSINGFFAHLEKDSNDGHEELRLLFLSDTKTLPVPIYIGDWTLLEGLEKMFVKSISFMKGRIRIPSEFPDLIPLVQLILYLCAENVDMPSIPIHPAKRVRNSGQVDVQKEQRIWNVGERIGSVIRKDRNESMQYAKTGTGKTGSSKRSHLRRAHFHHFWTGTGDKKSLVLRWLPPTLVGGDDENPVVIHKVKK